MKWTNKEDSRSLHLREKRDDNVMETGISEASESFQKGLETSLGMAQVGQGISEHGMDKSADTSTNMTGQATSVMEKVFSG